MATVLVKDSPTAKQHSREADELDWLCRKLSDVRVHPADASRNATTTDSTAKHNSMPVISGDGAALDDENDSTLRLRDLSPAQMAQLVQQLRHRSVNPEAHRQATIKFRKLLAHQDIHPYLDRIVDEDMLIPSFCQLLADETATDELLFETAWILTNIAAGTTYQTKKVVDAGVVPLLVDLLAKSPHKEIREQCIWCLGNIAGDGSELRASVLDAQALDLLLALITSEMNAYLNASTYVVIPPTHLEHYGAGTPQREHHFNLSTLRISIWALSNFCRGSGRSDLDWNLVGVAMPVLSQVITCCSPDSPHHDDEILMDACWALSRTLRGIHDGVESVVVPRELCAQIGSLITYDKADVQLPALRCLINIVSGSDEQTQVVLDADILPRLHHMLLHAPNDTTRKETCLIVSNITAGTASQVDAVLRADGMLECIIAMLSGGDKSVHWNVRSAVGSESAVSCYMPPCSDKVRRELCWALGNAVLGRVREHVNMCVNAGMVSALMDVVYNAYSTARGNGELPPDERMISKAMEAVASALRCDADESDADPSVQLMRQLNSMKLAPTASPQCDSAYVSRADLFDNGAIDTNQQSNTVQACYTALPNFANMRAVDVVRMLADGQAGYFVDLVSADIQRLAIEIAQHLPMQ